MPVVRAYLGRTSAIGRNVENRAEGDRTPPSGMIRLKAPLLADIMDNLNRGGNSAYACAEAHALAKLLRFLHAPINFRAIEFNCPVGFQTNGRELWELCSNCLGWLDKKSGWGPYKKFKIAEEILNVLQPPPTAAFNLNLESDVHFPKLVING